MNAREVGQLNTRYIDNRSGIATSSETADGHPAFAASVCSPMTVKQAIEIFLEDCETRNLSKHTMRMYSDRLRVFIEHLNALGPNPTIEDVTLEHLKEHLRNEAARGISVKTLNHARQVIRTLFKFLSDEELIDRDPSSRLRKIEGESKLINPLKVDEVQRIIDGFDHKTNIGLRNRLLVVLLYDTGLRISELLNIRLADVDWDQGIIKVMGKGRKEQLANIATSTKVLLRRYVRKRIDSEASQYLFQNQYGSPISRSYVAGILRAAGQRVGIDNVHPHRLRHSFATQYLSNGGDALTLQRELGHSSLEMVKRYVALQHKDITRKHIQYSPANQLNLHSRTRRSRIE